jgi:multiple sugar transport system permease protein
MAAGTVERGSAAAAARPRKRHIRGLSFEGRMLARSVVYFVLTVGLEMLLGIGIALLVRGMVWGKNLVISLVLMPMFMAPVIVGLLGRFLTDSTFGLYAWVLRETHVFSGEILGGTKSAFVAVTLMDVWEWTPLIALIVLAGLSSLPQPVMEAARVDGASYWQRLRYIVMPMIMGVVIVAAGVSTLIAVTLGTIAGYGLARSSFRGKDHVAFWIISTRMAPIAAAVLPLFVIFRAAHLLGTTTGLVVAYLSFNLPFAIWLMNAFFADLPPALEEAAMIDGATRWTAFRRIALPLVLPGVATTAILCLVFSWNDYAFASTFSGPDSQTLPIAASQLVTQTEIDWGQLTAIGTIVVAPMIVVGLVVRRWLVTGLTLGAVTGE